MRLINAHKLIMHLNDWMFAEGCEDGWNYEKDKTVPDYERQRAIYNTINQCIQAVMDQHAVDAEPVRHGHWSKDKRLFYMRCSECGAYVSAFLFDIFPIDAFGRDMHYCPNCGAKMEDI